MFHPKLRGVWLLMVGLALLITACAPRAATQAGQTSAACTQTRTVAGARVALSSSPCPGRAGKETVSIRVSNDNGQPVPDARVGAAYHMRNMDMPGFPKQLDMAPSDGGGYQSSAVLGMSGTWIVQVHVELPEGATDTEFPVDVE